MCGRYASFQQNQNLIDAFLIDSTLPLDPGLASWSSSWNVAPTTAVRIVVGPRSEALGPAHEPAPSAAPMNHSVHSPPAPRIAHPGRSLRVARWGLVPSWADSPAGAARMINARSESLAEKPSFASAFASRRCLIPADGYYEWHTPTDSRGTKIPYYIQNDDGGSGLAFAGLYEFWRDPARGLDDPARWLTTCTIVTAPATGSIAAIHDRVPVMLTPHVWDAWLAPGTTPAVATQILRSPGPDLAWHTVGTRVNAVANDSPDLLLHVPPERPTHTEPPLFTL